MTTITINRATVEQALEALEAMQSYAAAERKGLRICDEAIAALRAALAQQAEPVSADAAYQRWLADTHAPALRRMDSQGAFAAGWQAALAQQAEPAQEPMYWEVRCNAHPKWVRVDEQRFDEYISHGWEGQKLYTAPPQRVPLTDEEILDAVGWGLAEMYMKLTPNFPVDEAKKETLKNARAVERKVRGEEK